MKIYRNLLAASVLTVGIIAFSNIVIVAQQRPAQPDRTIDAAAQTEVIDAALENINRSYVFPEVAKKMEKRVRKQAESGAYSAISSGRDTTLSTGPNVKTSSFMTFGIGSLTSWLANTL